MDNTAFISSDVLFALKAYAIFFADWFLLAFLFSNMVNATSYLSVKSVKKWPTKLVLALTLAAALIAAVFISLETARTYAVIGLAISSSFHLSDVINEKMILASDHNKVLLIVSLVVNALVLTVRFGPGGIVLLGVYLAVIFFTRPLRTVRSEPN